jgi:hypothetical protein
LAARAATLAVAVLVAAVIGAGCDSAFRFDQPPSANDGGPAGDGASRPPCADDSQCGGLRCQVSTGACVACGADGDCTGARPKCDTTMGLCVECNATSDCPTPTQQRCDAVTKRCLDLCVDRDDCPNGAVFSCTKEPTFLCAECTQDPTCIDPLKQTCDKSIGRCVECTGNAQCPTAEKPVCDRRSGRCEACVVSAECESGFVCDPATLTCRQLP